MAEDAHSGDIYQGNTERTRPRAPKDSGLCLLSNLHVFCIGLLIGVAAFLLALLFIGRDVSTPGDHDLRLANNLGFIYAPLIGFWVGMVRRSLLWTLAGVGIGSAIGTLYKMLCGYDFLSVMVTYPCLLGGVASVALGYGRASWFDGVVARFFKGMAAGLVLGFTYMVVLNVLFFVRFPVFNPWANDYRRIMWFAGTIAMGISSGLFLVLFHWSADLGSRSEE